MELTSNFLLGEIIKLSSLVENLHSSSLNFDKPEQDTKELYQQIEKSSQEINDHAFKYLALKAPNSRDLRVSISVLKLTTLLKQYSSLSLQNKTHISELQHYYLKLDQLGRFTGELLSKTIDSLTHTKLDLNEELSNNVKELEIMAKELSEELTMAMEAGEEKLSHGHSALQVANNLKYSVGLVLEMNKEAQFIDNGPVQEGSENSLLIQNLDKFISTETLNG